MTTLLRYGFKGNLYPINPTSELIQGVVAYRSVLDLPGAVDLAVLAIRAENVPETLLTCVQQGIPAALILSSGFSEAGQNGADLERRVADIGRNSGILVAGPNSLGMFNFRERAIVTFASALDIFTEFRIDPVALVSQSGALGNFVLADSHDSGIGFEYFMATGNEACLDLSDYVTAAVEDDRVEIIAGYVEGFRNGQKFMAAARHARRAGKPVIILKAGKSSGGANAARSHTGALAGTDDVVDGALRDSRVVRVSAVENILDRVQAFLGRPRACGPRVGLITTSGGHGVIAADECQAAGLELAELHAHTKALLAEAMPDFGSNSNPVDLTATVVARPEIFKKACSAMLQAPEVDVLVVLMGALYDLSHRLISDLIDCRDKTSKAVFVVWVAATDQMLAELRAHRIPAYTDPARCMSSLADVISWQDRRLFERPFDSEHQPAVAADPSSIRVALEAEGVTFAQERTFASAEDLYKESHDVLRELGVPLVAKVSAPGLHHKSDVGGVRVGIESAEELVAAWKQFADDKYLSSLESLSMVVQEQVVDGVVELLVGSRFDPQFGSVIVCALGGVLTEVFNDKAVRPAPVGTETAREMLQELSGFRLFQGVRGGPAADIESAIATLVAVSKVVAAAGASLNELDLNPVIVRPRGLGTTVVDMLVVPGK